MKLDRVIAQLRKLNEPVPNPARLPGVSEVEAAQQAVGFAFHADFIQYLLEASNVTFGIFEPVTLTEPDSHTYLPTVAADAWRIGIPRDDYLPICQDNADFYCMNARGAVVFMSHDGDFAPSERWPDLATWIEEVWIGESLDGEDDESDEDGED